MEAASATDEGASGEELLVEHSSGSEEPLGTPGASSGPRAVRGHLVRLRAARQTSITSISTIHITVDVVGKSTWQQLSDEVASAAPGSEGDPDATEGEED